MFYYCACVLLLASPALCYYSFQEQIPNGNNLPHPCLANYRWQGVGHENAMGGGKRNSFGRDFHEIGGNMWTKELCMMDSDGDGKTNGEELGDPKCEWSPGQPPSRNVDITHPGVCTPYGEGICAGRDTFVSCKEVSFDTCEVAKNPEVKTKDFNFTSLAIPKEETSYFCMTFDLPQDQDYHMVAYEALIDNREVMHHALVYGCKGDMEKTDKPEVCSGFRMKCLDLIGIWQVGSPGKCFSDKIGFPIGKSSYTQIQLQFHYNNPKLVDDYTDSSGIRLYYRPARPEVHDLAVFWTGQMQMAIPPGQSEVKFESRCPSSCTSALLKSPTYVAGGYNHMHYLGKSMKIVIYRNGQFLRDLTNDKIYNYDSPVAYSFDPPVEILPGDELRTTCVYNSLSSKGWVYSGYGTKDEMCIGILFVYPAQNLVSGYCISRGPLSTCDLYAGTPIGECNWAAFTNTSHPYSKEVNYYLKRDCNLDGFCRPECRESLERVKKHPCLNGVAASFVNGLLMESKDGLKMLGRLNSCAMDSPATTTQSPKEPTDCRDECKDICYPGGNDGWDSASTGSQTGVTALVIFASTLFAYFFL